MKKRYVITISALFLILLSIATISQFNPNIKSDFDITLITPNLEVKEESICTTEFYTEEIENKGECTYYNNFTTCLNTTGENTDCSNQQSVYNYPCVTGISLVQKNRTECKPNNEFIISIDKGETTLQKSIDFSDWGPCIKEEKGDCLIVTCVSYNDGAHLGKFTDCNGGKSCQRFEICEDKTTTYYKNSRDDFVTDDPTFTQSRLQMSEVKQ